MADLLTLRNVYKVKTVHIQPMRQANGAHYPFVKRVRYDENGNSEMLLSEAEKNDPNSSYFIPEDLDIVLTEGKTFDLDNPLEKNIWECIKHSDIIVPSRGAKNEKGDLIIDGDKRRYGTAEFWIDKPGEDSREQVTRKKRIVTAQNYVFEDSADGKLTKCKLLGRSMRNAPASDIEAYLLERAESDPALIIELYTNSDTGFRLMIIDAKEKGVIRFEGGLNWYGDTVLGSTEDTMIQFFKTPQNANILSNIKREVYPEMTHAIGNIPVTKSDNTKEPTMEEMINNVSQPKAPKK